MKQREQITRGRLRAQISIEAVDGGVCIFCPTEVSERLYQYFAARDISSSPPRPAIFSPFYPLHELIVTLPLDQASAEVTEFVAGLPKI